MAQGWKALQDAGPIPVSQVTPSFQVMEGANETKAWFMALSLQPDDCNGGDDGGNDDGVAAQLKGLGPKPPTPELVAKGSATNGRGPPAYDEETQGGVPSIVAQRLSSPSHSFDCHACVSACIDAACRKECRRLCRAVEL